MVLLAAEKSERLGIGRHLVVAGFAVDPREFAGIPIIAEDCSSRSISSKTTAVSASASADERVEVQGKGGAHRGVIAGIKLQGSAGDRMRLGKQVSPVLARRHKADQEPKRRRNLLNGRPLRRWTHRVATLPAAAGP